MGFLDKFKKKDVQNEPDLTFTNSIESEALFSKATKCLQERENEKAVELFDQLLKREPENIHALNGKGSGLMQSGRIEEAEEVFNQSLEIRDNGMAYMNKAIINGNRGDFDKGIEYCDKVIAFYPELKDVAIWMKSTFMENKNKSMGSDLSQFNSEAQDLINRANELKDKEEIWHNDMVSELQPNAPEFRKVNEWKAWGLYEEAIRKDPKCEALAVSCINEIKERLLNEFMIFDISQNPDFNPEREIDNLKLQVMRHIYEGNFTVALAEVDQILTTIDENDLDALNYKGTLLFYLDEIDESIKCFETIAGSGNGIYEFYGDFNKTFPLRRKTMITGDAEYMVQALDIYDEMLKDPMTFEKIKPYQREILDTLQDFMQVPLF